MTNKALLTQNLCRSGIVDGDLHSVFTGKCQVLVDTDSLIILSPDMKKLKKFKLACGDLSYRDYALAADFINEIVSDLKKELSQINPRQLQVAPTTSLAQLQMAFSTIFGKIISFEVQDWNMTPAQLLVEYRK